MELNRKNLLALVKTGMNRMQLSIAALERDSGVPRDTIRDFLRGKTQILRADKLQKVLRILEPQHKVPVTGFVGDETRIFFQPGDQWVDCPPGLDPSDVTAVRIDGDSMSPVFLDGWIVYYSNNTHLHIPALKGGWQVPYHTAEAGKDSAGAFIGKPCIVKIKSGDTMLRTLKHGSIANRYNLVSYNCKEIKNADLEWVSKIIFIKTE